MQTQRDQTQGIRLEYEVESLHLRVVDFTVELKFIKREVEHAGEEARGKGIQGGFKVFRQLMLRLYPDFNIGTLKAFITPKVVEEVVIEVEDKVAAICGTALKAASASGGEAEAETRASAGVSKVIEIEYADGG